MTKIDGSKTFAGFVRTDAAPILRAEAARLAEMRARSTPPETCGPAIPAAPARGAFRVFQPVELMPKGADEWVPQPAGYRGRDALAAADVFDRMLEHARRRREVAPFTAGQVSIARHYRDLIERHDAGGFKLSSLEAGRVGGSGGRDVADMRLGEARQIEAMRRRIGAGVAMSVRRIRPSSRGGAARGVISDRALVDAVCLGGETISEVLRAHGWATKGDHREALRRALADALDRMHGYGEKGLDR